MPVKWADPDPPPALRIKPVASRMEEHQQALGPVTPGPNGYLATVGANNLELYAKGWAAHEAALLRAIDVDGVSGRLVMVSK